MVHYLLHTMLHDLSYFIYKIISLAYSIQHAGGTCYYTSHIQYLLVVSFNYPASFINFVLDQILPEIKIKQAL